MEHRDREGLREAKALLASIEEERELLLEKAAPLNASLKDNYERLKKAQEAVDSIEYPKSFYDNLTIEQLFEIDFRIAERNFDALFALASRYNNQIDIFGYNPETGKKTIRFSLRPDIDFEKQWEMLSPVFAAAYKIGGQEKFPMTTDDLSESGSFILKIEKDVATLSKFVYRHENILKSGSIKDVLKWAKDRGFTHDI